MCLCAAQFGGNAEVGSLIEEEEYTAPIHYEKYISIKYYIASNCIHICQPQIS